MASTKLSIYTTATCGYCHHAKSFMSQKGIQFEEIRVDLDETKAHEMIHLTGQSGVPVISNGKQFVVGYDPKGIARLAQS
jgi:glutaredoxin 3